MLNNNNSKVLNQQKEKNKLMSGGSRPLASWLLSLYSEKDTAVSAVPQIYGILWHKTKIIPKRKVLSVVESLPLTVTNMRTSVIGSSLTVT